MASVIILTVSVNGSNVKPKEFDFNHFRHFYKKYCYFYNNRKSNKIKP